MSNFVSVSSSEPASLSVLFSVSDYFLGSIVFSFELVLGFVLFFVLVGFVFFARLGRSFLTLFSIGMVSSSGSDSSLSSEIRSMLL